VDLNLVARAIRPPNLYAGAASERGLHEHEQEHEQEHEREEPGGLHLQPPHLFQVL